jgi:uncharacterized MnhB-related membrane protein
MCDTSRLSSGRKTAFTLAETIGAIFILAVVAAVCVAIIANRNTQFDKTAAMSGAPAAIDALSYYFDNKADVATTNAAILSGKAVRVVCRVKDGGESLWQVAESEAFTSMEGVSGPVYVATLSNPTLYEHSRAVEFDVSLGWVPPGAASESAAEIQARIAAPAELCQYRAIILRK